jgi:hypothetical protein
MRPGHSSRRADEADGLPTRYGVADGNERLAQVKVSGDHTSPVIDVDHSTGKKERIDQCHDAAVRGAHRGSDGSREVDTEMSAGDGSIEGAAGAEAARDAGCPRFEEDTGPARR